MTVWELIEVCGVISELLVEDFKEILDKAFGGDDNEENPE